MPAYNDSTKKAFLVQSVKRKMLYYNDTVTFQTVTNMGIFGWIPRFGTVTPIELDISYGLSDDPTDEVLEFYCNSVDVDNLPDVTSLRFNSFWGALQQWRAVGTPANVIQTMTREVQDFLNPPTFAFTELAGFTQRQGVSLITYCGSSSDVLVLAVLTYLETVLQRVWGDDDVHGGLGEDAYNACVCSG